MFLQGVLVLASLHQPTLAQEGPALAGRTELILLVASDQHSAAVPAILPQSLKQKPSGPPIQGEPRLIQHQQLRAQPQQPGQGDDLPLSAGERIQPPVHQVLPAERGQRRLRRGIGGTPPLVRRPSSRDRTSRQEPPGQPQLIAHIAGHPGLLGLGVIAQHHEAGPCRTGSAGAAHPAPVLQESCGQPAERGDPGALRAQHRHHLPGEDLQVHAAQRSRLRTAMVEARPGQLQHRRGPLLPGTRQPSFIITHWNHLLPAARSPPETTDPPQWAAPEHPPPTLSPGPR